MPLNAFINVSEVGIDVPMYANAEQWRIGKPSDKLGVTIFMRIATRHDTVLNDASSGIGETSHLSNEELRQKNIKLSEYIMRPKTAFGCIYPCFKFYYENFDHLSL